MWADKLTRNVERDRDTDHRLTADGWLPVHVWEHEDMTEAAARVRDLVLARSCRPRTPGSRRRVTSKGGDGGARPALERWKTGRADELFRGLAGEDRESLASQDLGGECWQPGNPQVRRARLVADGGGLENR